MDEELHVELPKDTLCPDSDLHLYLGNIAHKLFKQTEFQVKNGYNGF